MGECQDSTWGSMVQLNGADWDKWFTRLARFGNLMLEGVEQIGPLKFPN